MDTQSIVIAAIAVNLVVALIAVGVSFRRGRRSGSVSAAGAAAARSVDVAAARPQLPVEAGAPWFPGRNGNGSAPSSVGSGRPATDPRTGLDLSPAWTRWLSEEDARVRRFHRPATVVLVELSGFDRLADRLGDESAERLIPPIATTMRKNARATDHLARLGPTRFGALLTETDEVQAINYIERVRSACDVWLEAGAVMLRLSVGWAEIGPECPADVALLEAERRLFEERQRARTMLARQPDERAVELSVLRPSQA